MKKSILHEAIRIARSKLATHPELDGFAHYTFLCENNKIVEWATNSRGVPPIHFGFASRLVDADYGPKFHSEINCWRRAKGLLTTNALFDIINIRFNKSGILKNSKPCHCCYNFLQAMGLRHCWFSTELGFARI